MKSNTYLGLIGVLGIWLTAGLALPFVNVLKAFTPEQLMVFRGFLTASMAFIGLGGKFSRVDHYTWLIAITMPFATLGLFEGIRHWGAGPTIIIITATPVVNIIVSFFLGRQISAASIIGLILVLGGVIIANGGGRFQLAGFLWTIFGTIMNGILYEFFARAKALPLQKCFYACLGMGILGLILSSLSSSTVQMNASLITTLLGFAFIGGLLYWYANLLAFEHLPTPEASVLAQGETPAVIIGAFFLLGERLIWTQSIGVVVSIIGACYLSWWLAKKQPKSSAPL